MMEEKPQRQKTQSASKKKRPSEQSKKSGNKKRPANSEQAAVSKKARSQAEKSEAHVSAAKKKRKNKPTQATEAPQKPSGKKRPAQKSANAKKKPTNKTGVKKRRPSASAKKRKQQSVKHRRSPIKIVLSILSTVIFLLVLAASIILLVFFGRAEISGNDMEPSMMNQESILYRKLSTEDSDSGALDLARFDIVLMQNPENPSEIGIKRIVGLPGENVNYENGQLFVNGNQIAEDFYEGVNSSYYLATENNFTMDEILQLTPELANNNSSEYIPSNYYLVLGDNRTVAVDSRQFGLLSADNIVGKVEWVLFPFSSFGKVG